MPCNALLGSLGLSKSDVFANLAKSMGKSVEEIRKMQETGKIGSEEAIKAIMSTMDAKFGGMMKTKSQMLSGMISTLVSKPFELLNKAFEDKGGGIMAFYESIKSVNEALFDSKGDPTKVGQEIIDSISKMGNALKEVVGVGREFFTGFFEGLSENRDGISSLTDSMGNLDLKKMGAEAKDFGKDMAVVADATAKLASAITKLSESEGAMSMLGAVFAVISGTIQQTVQLAMMIAYPFMMAGKPASLTSSLGIGSPTQPATVPSMPGEDARVLPSMTSSTAPIAGAGAANVAGGGTINHNTVSAVVSGGMFPEEIAAIVRSTVKTELERL